MLQLCVCRDIEHLGSLESTKEALLEAQLLSLFRALQTSQLLNISTQVLLKHELIVLQHCQSDQCGS